MDKPEDKIVTPDPKVSFKTPLTKELIGILLSAELVESKGREVILLSIQDSEDEVTIMSTSPGYWKKVGKLFPVDSCVKTSYEVRIADTTGYMDGEVAKKHIASGNNLTAISRFSQLSYQRMLDKLDMAEGVAVLSSVEDGKVNAVATYLAAFVRKG
jgi:hypothetical protein